MTAVREAPPFIRRNRTTAAIMGDVCLALVPCMTAAVWFFGLPAALRLLTALVASGAADLLVSLLRKRPLRPDGSAAVTGLILALSCPAGIPYWLLVVLSLTAIWLFKEMFGGLGYNLFNPAMAARALLLTGFPAYLSGTSLPDAVSSATPLSQAPPSDFSGWANLFIGRVNGAMGETSALMILLGAVWLLARRVIRLRAPATALAAFALVAAMGGESLPAALLSGSILFGVVFIFTDYTGKPATPAGEWLFAIGAGALTAWLRLNGRYPEGVCFATLLMNLLSPLLEWLTLPRVFGTKRRPACTKEELL